MTLFDLEPDDAARRVTLVRLAALIARSMGEIGTIVVEGEVHRPSTSPGRQWFTLRDRAAQVSVSVPATRRARCRAVAGERVAVTGRLDWVSARGELQLVADQVVPVGEGAIAAMIAEARRRLDVDGLLARPRRQIPTLPACIGIVCGREAAVRADIESVIAARFPGYPVVFVETTVSGGAAVDHIIDALRRLDDRPEVEVIILARGGGDATQLLPFSDEDLCRAVCAARTPVVAAIGHDADRPLVDEVADLRCGTPSLAASAVVPDRTALLERLDTVARAAAAALQGRVDAAAAALGRVDRAAAARGGFDTATRRLGSATARLGDAHPARELARAQTRLAGVGWRDAATPPVAAAERALSAARAHADALSPQRVLERGYAVVRRANDLHVVRDPGEAAAGTELAIQVAGGAVAAVVQE